MLQQMRKYTQGWLSAVFLGALALSFALWGVADIFRGGGSADVVATVGSSEISTTDFSRRYKDETRQLENELGGQVTSEKARAAGLPQLTLDKLVDEAALNAVATSLGLSISDADISSRIQADRRFAGVLGTFDRSRFDQFAQSLGFNEQGFMQILRQEMAIEQIALPLQTGFQVPDGYFAALLTGQNEARAVEYVIVTSETAGTIAPPSDAQLMAYVKAHQDRFSTPEYRDVTYAWLSPKDVMGGLKVTPNEIAQEYQSKKDTYVVPEKRDLEQLIFPGEAEAKAARAKIDGGQTFAQLAASLGKSQADIAAGTGVPKDSLDKDRGAAAFAIREGDVTPPVKGPFGWVLIHVTKITQGKFVSLADATGELTKALMDRLAVSKLADNANAYQDAINTGAEVPEAAQKSGMHSTHIPAIDADGKAPDGTNVATAVGDELRTQVFRAEVGEPSDPIQAKDGTYYALKVNGLTPPKPKPFADVRAAALAAWMDEHKATAAETRAQQLARDGQKAQSLAEAAQSLGERVELSGRLTRTSHDDNFSDTLIRTIFEAPPGGVVSGPRGKGGGYVIARVIGIVHPAIPVSAPMFQQGKLQFSQEASGDITFALAKATSKKLGVKTNQKAIDQAVGGEGS